MYKNTEEYKELIKSIANAINTICGELDISYAEFAHRIGVIPQQISNYVCLKITPKAIFIVKMSKTFNVSTDWIMGVSEKR